MPNPLVASPQAKTVLLIGSVSMLTYIIAAGFTFGPFWSILLALFTLPIVILLTYDVGCLMTGGCKVWSWIVTALFMAIYAVVTVMSILMIVGNKK